MMMEIQPNGTRVFQCLECDELDPLKSPSVRKLLDTLKPPEDK
jgi:hypothetical protein